MKQITTRASRKKLYAALGLPETASETEIRESYLCISRSHHPDIPGSRPELFLAALQAFEVLTDRVRRKLYDQHGIDPTDAGTSSLRKMAVSAIEHAMFRAIAEGTNGNLITETIEILNEDLRGAKEAIRNGKTEAAKYAAASARITDRWEGSGPIKGRMLAAIERERNEILQQIAKTEEAKECIGIAIALLSAERYAAVYTAAGEPYGLNLGIGTLFVEAAFMRNGLKR